MGEKAIPAINPNWRFAGRVLTTAEVAWILRRSEYHVLELRKNGILRAVNNERPYTFDPEHIFQYAFGSTAQDRLKQSEHRSLKIEERDESVHKPLAKAKKGDLWT